MENNFMHDDETINEFLISMSDEVLMINIEEQIKDSNNSDENYFETITNKLESILAILPEEDYELVNRVKDFQEELFDKVQRLLQDRFAFTCDFKSYSNRGFCLKELYKFFVIRKKNLLQNLVMNYINKEFDSLIVSYGQSKINKKDISFINSGNSNIEKEKLSLLLNVQNIIDGIQIPDVDECLELLIDDKEEFTNNLIISMKDTFEIEFKPEFISIIMKEIKKEKNSLIMNTRLKLMN